MNIGVATSVGLVRDHNEDACFLDQNLFVVCDGMGGHQAGEVASALAIEVIKNFHFSQGQLEQQIKSVIEQAHQRIMKDAQKRGLTGMGTTVTLALLTEDSQTRWLHIGHVGDSRAYLWRDGQLVQLTNDHSVVAELIRNGSLTEGEANTHPHRHVLTQALGVGEINIESHCHRLNSKDMVLICSDGLTNAVDEVTITEVIRNEEPQIAADKLVELADEQGGLDNTTLLIVEIP